MRNLWTGSTTGGGGGNNSGVHHAFETDRLGLLPLTADRHVGCNDHDQHANEPDAAPALRLIPLDRIVPDPANPRQSMHGIEELAETIKAFGMLEVLVVTPDADSDSGNDGCYRILSGERRYWAHKLLDHTHVEAIVRPVIENEIERRHIALVANLQRRDLNPVELAEALQRQLDDDPRIQSQRDLATMFGFEENWMSQALAPMKLPLHLRAKLRTSAVSICRDSIHRIIVIDDAETQERLVNAILAGATNVQIRADIARIQRRPLRRIPRQVFETSVHASVIVQSKAELSKEQAVNELKRAVELAEAAIQATAPARLPKARRRIAAALTWMVAALGAVVLTTSTAAQIPCHYEVTHIIQGPSCGSFGLPPTYASAISPSGRYVVGYYQCPLGPDRAFSYDTTTNQFTTLPLGPGFYETRAEDVNNDGIVCGTGSKTSAGGQRGFVYNLNNGEWTELTPPDPTGEGWSNANAINAVGQVCGWRSLDDGGDPVHPWGAFVWSPTEGFFDLGVMNGPNSNALDISDMGTVVGYTGDLNYTLTDSNRAFIHQSGKTVILDPVPNGINSVAWAVNNPGQVLLAGKVQESPTIVRAFLCNAGTCTELPPLQGFLYSLAFDLSDSGIAVGASRNVNPALISSGTAWIGSIALDLDAMGPANSGLVIEDANEISAAGQIAGVAHGSSGYVAVVLSPLQNGPGDSNCDQLVNVADLLNVLNEWGPCNDCIADLTGNGIVNGEDLFIVLRNWTR